jgi:hypothetical protein
MIMYVRKSITAGELIAELQKAIADLSLLNEDEPVMADCCIGDNKHLMNDLMYDRDSEWPAEINEEEIKELFTHIQPKDIHNYFLDSELVARDNDSYYDGLREERHRAWHNVLKMQIPEELREKYGL